ncbi:MAG: DUF3293 domain-containing protein [Granulosicoccus sp.]|nr:DUF3293 domain-containing protein [Granulosicoccus sp.]
MSVKTAHLINNQAQIRLEKQLRARNVRTIDAIGLDPDPNSNWPSESGVLALDLELRVAKQLAHQHRQKAIVWCSVSAVPRLHMLV